MVAASLAILSLAILTGAASANRSLAIEGTNPITASGRSVFRSSFINVSCNLTLRGSITRSTVAKSAARTSAGVFAVITEGRTNPERNCTDNLFGTRDSATVNNTNANPIRLQYAIFLGTLPNINGVLVEALNADFTLELPGFGARCRFVGTDGGLFSETGGRQAFNQARFLESIAIPGAAENREPCPASGSLQSTVSVSPAIRIRLL